MLFIINTMLTHQWKKNCQPIHANTQKPLEGETYPLNIDHNKYYL
jgi:hypothetical protein